MTSEPLPADLGGAAAPPSEPPAGPPDPPEGRPGGPIRVVDAARRAADVFALSEDELETLLRDAPAGSHEARQALLSFAPLVADARADERARPTPRAVALLAGRQLMYDAGVLPFGRNLSARPPGGAGRRAAVPSDGEGVRPPVRKELWHDTPPRNAAGRAFTAWATGAAATDTIAVEGYVVDLDQLSEGPGAVRLRGRVALEEFFALPPAIEVRPDLAAGRLAGARPRALRLTRWASLEDAPALGRALILLREISQGSVGRVLAGLAAPDRAGAGAEEAGAEEAGAEEAGAEEAGAEEAGATLRELVDGYAEGPTGAVLAEMASAPRAASAKYRAALEAAAAALEDALDVRAAPSAAPLALACRLVGLGGQRLVLAELAGDAAAAREFAAELRGARLAAAAARAAERREHERAARARQYLGIARRLLGTERYGAIARHLASDPLARDANDPRAVLAAVDATAPAAPRGRRPAAGADSATVAREFANQQENWKAAANNPCPHVGLAARLRRAVAVDQQQELLRQLRDWAAPPDPPGSKGPAELQWLMCKSCGFRLVCPHVLEQYELARAAAPYEQVRRALARYSDPTAFNDPGRGLSYAYYCRVCSEELFSRTGEIDPGRGAIEELGLLGAFDDELRRWMWGRVLSLLQPMRGRAVLRVVPAVNPALLAREVVDACHPLAVRAAGGGARRAVRGGAEDVERLFALLYVYAYVFSLAVTTQLAERQGASRALRPEEERAVKVFVEGAPARAAPDALAQALLTHLVRNDGGIVARLEGVDDSKVANQFKVAYGQLVQLHGSQVLVARDSTQAFLTDLTMLNPYYRAIETAAGVARGDIRAPRDASRAFEEVMGGDLASFTRASFDKKLAPFVAAALGRRGGIEMPQGVDPLWAYRLEELGVFRRAWGTRKGAARDMLEAREKAILAADLGGAPAFGAPPTAADLVAGDRDALLDPIWIGGEAPRRGAGGRGDGRGRGAGRGRGDGRGRGAGRGDGRGRGAGRGDGRGAGASPLSPAAGRQGDPLTALRTDMYRDALACLVRYTTRVHGRADWDSYLRLAHHARARSRRNQEAIGTWGIPAYDLRLPPGLRQYRLDGAGAPLARVYDERGERHVWSKYYWAAADQPDAGLTLSSAEIRAHAAAARAAPDAPQPLAGLRFVDWVCGGCGARWSQAGELDAALVQRSLAAKEELDSFFAYYDSRCPKGGLHSYAAGACARCGLDAALLDPAARRRDAPAALKYYDQYRDAYQLARVKLGEFAAAASGPPAGANASKAIAAEELRPVEESAALAPARRRDYDAVMKGAALGGVAVAELEAVGAAAGRSVEEVQAGVNAPAPAVVVGDPRVLAADGLVRVLLTRYCAFYYLCAGARATAAPAQPPEAWLAAAAKECGADLPAPDALGVQAQYFEPYGAALAAVRQGRGPDEGGATADDLVQFSLEAFCRLALRIADSGAKKFAQQAVALAARGELLFAKPGEFKWAVFGDSESRSLEADDSSQDDFRRYGEAGSGAEDVYNERAKLGAGADAFSLEHTDLDRATAQSNLDE